MILISVGAAIDYCYLDACICDQNYIACSRFLSYEPGTFLVANPRAVQRIHFFNSVIYYLDFVFDFENLEFLVLLDSSANCTALQRIARLEKDLTIDASTTCPGKSLH